jgi:hypothetical protein
MKEVFDSTDSVLIMLELMESGELFHRIKKSQKLKEDEAK